MVVYFQRAISNLIYGLTIKTVDGTTVYGTNTRMQGLSPDDKQAGDVAIIRFSFPVRLMHSEYFISLGVAQDCETEDNIAVDRRYDLIHLKVTGEDDSFGLVSLDARAEEVGLKDSNQTPVATQP